MNTQNFKRRLTAILSADVEGYSRLMRDNEDETVRTITAYRAAIAKFVEQYRGRVVDSPGDNILVEFGSGLDAVNCAVEIQWELAERNEELADERKMKFRIGVNSGDVIKKILKHLGLWDIKARPPPKRANAPPPDIHAEYSHSQVPLCEDHLYYDPDYPIETYAS